MFLEESVQGQCSSNLISAGAFPNLCVLYKNMQWRCVAKRVLLREDQHIRVFGKICFTALRTRINSFDCISQYWNISSRLSHSVWLRDSETAATCSPYHTGSYGREGKCMCTKFRGWKQSPVLSVHTNCIDISLETYSSSHLGRRAWQWHTISVLLTRTILWNFQLDSVMLGLSRQMFKRPCI